MRKLFVVIAVMVMAAQLFMVQSLVSGPPRADAKSSFIPCVCLKTEKATHVGITTATLNGQIICQELQGGDTWRSCANIWFVYGTSENTMDMSTEPVLFTKNGQHSEVVTNLQPCTKYYYRIVASEAGCPKNGNSMLPGSYYLAGYDISTLGAGIGLKPGYHRNVSEVVAYTCPAESFTTQCEDEGVGPGSSGGGTVGTPANQKTIRPFLEMSAISVKSATISSPSVGPGQTVVVKANVTNSGTGNGVARITVYVNGVEESAQPATIASGQSSTLEFTVTRNEPGTYSVVVNNVPAGSFTVGLFNGNDMLIYGSIALVAIGFGGILYMLTRKRNTA